MNTFTYVIEITTNDGESFYVFSLPTDLPIDNIRCLVKRANTDPAPMEPPAKVIADHRWTEQEMETYPNA